jgi:enamine deaminase RidA (YjgF/YER057c/UK114 family)
MQFAEFDRTLCCSSESAAQTRSALAIENERMANIRRFGDAERWSDVVAHNGTAYWVQVAQTLTLDARGPIAQVLGQIDMALAMLGADRTRLLQVLIYLADLADAPVLNEAWDAWVLAGHAPVRACVQAQLAAGDEVQMVVTAAIPNTGANP